MHEVKYRTVSSPDPQVRRTQSGAAGPGGRGVGPEFEEELSRWPRGSISRRKLLVQGRK